MGQTLWPLMAVLSRGLIIMVGGWMAITMTSSGVVGLAIVTAAGLVVAGGIISVAFWLKMPASP